MVIILPVPLGIRVLLVETCCALRCILNAPWDGLQIREGHCLTRHWGDRLQDVVGVVWSLLAIHDGCREGGLDELKHVLRMLHGCQVHGRQSQCCHCCKHLHHYLLARNERNPGSYNL